MTVLLAIALVLELLAIYLAWRRDRKARQKAYWRGRLDGATRTRDNFQKSLGGS